MQDFTTQLPDYRGFRDHFSQWAAASLPGDVTDEHSTYVLLNFCSEKPPPARRMDDICPLITVSLNEDKFPRLDLPEDLEDVTVKMIKNALTEYMIMAWGMYFVSLIRCWLIT
jgi:hypothetical protein